MISFTEHGSHYFIRIPLRFIDRVILRGGSQAEMINWILKIEGSKPRPKW